MDFKAYLRYFGWSQAQFARHIGITPDTVSRWKEPPQLVMMYLKELYSRNEWKVAEDYFLDHPEECSYVYNVLQRHPAGSSFWERS